jgi:hypothetical protein
MKKKYTDKRELSFPEEITIWQIRSGNILHNLDLSKLDDFDLLDLYKKSLAWEEQNRLDKYLTIEEYFAPLEPFYNEFGFLTNTSRIFAPSRYDLDLENPNPNNKETIIDLRDYLNEISVPFEFLLNDKHQTIKIRIKGNPTTYDWNLITELSANISCREFYFEEKEDDMEFYFDCK